MFYKVSVYSRPEDRGLLVWRWKKQFLGEWVESRQEFEDCDHCVHHALQDAKGQSVHLETDRCTLYRYRFESMLHQYGSCYCLSGGRSAEAVLDLIAQIEERHNVIVLRNGQPFFAHYRADLQAEGTLAPELWQGVEWRGLEGRFEYVRNRNSPWSG